MMFIVHTVATKKNGKNFYRKHIKNAAECHPIFFFCLAFKPQNKYWLIVNDKDTYK